jgi:glycine/D-amino acid oxidase-like deaminating enzyme
MKIGVVGGGIFGLAAALELAARGHDVTIVERGAIPADTAASNDTSKTIQRLYGQRERYVDLAERAEVQWRRWQELTDRHFYFPIGHLLVTRGFAPGSRAYDSNRTLGGRGNQLELLTPSEATRRFPQFTYHADDSILFDPWGGYLASGLALTILAAVARSAGVKIREGEPSLVVADNSSAAHIVTAQGTMVFDWIVVAVGAWLGRLVPALDSFIRVTRQCMAFFAPDDPVKHQPGPLPVWAVDAPGDGWYGHPLADGRVKLADNPLGETADPESHRDARPGFAAEARAFAGRWLPGLDRGTLLSTHSCLYDNTPDGDFIVDWAPGASRILVAGGGSGHGFKFGGAIGPIIADALEERDNPLGREFRLSRRSLEYRTESV